MSAHCCSSAPDPSNSPRWRRALWIALAVNGAMFVAEMAAGLAAGSMALRADALDFLGDSANYAISLMVVGMALTWRARAAMLKGATLLLFGLWILLSTGWAALHGSAPEPAVMGTFGVVALVANVAVAALLYRYRTGDANMRSVWICSRNDAVGNVAVMLAALGVFGTGTAWPDLIVAALMAGLALWGGAQIVAQAAGELRGGSAPAHGHSAVDPSPASQR
ncbi:cation transporter [Sphingomonas flavalba]|uniref:cation transporter n=1 Tax=Sphingomonas flavalba TaxID=2559804 RepID=UPI0039DF9608